jgi:hypothetical protein
VIREDINKNQKNPGSLSSPSNLDTKIYVICGAVDIASASGTEGPDLNPPRFVRF